MLEVKVTIAITPELTGIINNLVAAISGKATQTQTASSTQFITAPTPMPTAPVQVTPTQPQAPAAPVTSVQQPVTPIAGVPLANAPQFSVDQIMAAGAVLMDAGRVEDLMKLLQSFGVQAVMDLKPEQLGAFATELRKLGAAI